MGEGGAGPDRAARARRLKATTQRLGDFGRRSMHVLRTAWQSFAEARGSEAAAALAYYALFSLFPLLLALVAGGSLFLERQQVFAQVVDLATEVFPVSQELIESNLQDVMRVRGAVGIVGLAGALWSATGVFTVLTRAISRAWPDARPRGFFRRRLVALSMVGAVALLLLLSLLSSMALHLLSRFHVPLGVGASVSQTPLGMFLSRALPWLLTFLLIWALYRWVPTVHVQGSAAFWAALGVAVAWQLAARAFTWYLGSGLARYRLVYGSLGALVALLVWIYVSSWLILFGAHLCAAIAGRGAGRG